MTSNVLKIGPESEEDVAGSAFEMTEDLAERAADGTIHCDVCEDLSDASPSVNPAELAPRAGAAPPGSYP